MISKGLFFEGKNKRKRKISKACLVLLPMWKSTVSRSVMKLPNYPERKKDEIQGTSSNQQWLVNQRFHEP